MNGIRKISRLLNAIPCIALLGFAAACTEGIIIDTWVEEETIIINSVLTDTPIYPAGANDDFRMPVYYSSGYFTPDYFDNKITGADIKISSSFGNSYKLKEISEGWYFHNNESGESGGIYVSPGETVTLDFFVDEGINPVYGNFSVSETVPEPVKLDSISIEPAKILGMNTYNVGIYAQDPPGEDNYYLFLITVKDSFGNIKYHTDRITSYILLDDSVSDGRYFDNMVINTSLSSAHNDGSSSGIIYLAPGDEVIVYMCSITNGYYRFLTQCQSAKNGTNPFFGGPPSNIFSNIPGGAGYFTGYCHTTAGAVVPESTRMDVDTKVTE